MWVDNLFKKEASVSEYIEPNQFVSLFDSGDKTLAIISAPYDLILKSKSKKDTLKKYFSDIDIRLFDAVKEEDIIESHLTHIQLKKWSLGKVVLLGDAAHGFEPHAGIGGSMGYGRWVCFGRRTNESIGYISCRRGSEAI